MAEGVRELAEAAARLGGDFVAAVRAGEGTAVGAMLVPEGSAARLFELFGLPLFELDLHLTDPRELLGQLAPYDFQMEGTSGLLELGLIVPSGPEPDAHRRRLFGASLLLNLADRPNYNGWRIEDLIPFNSDGVFDPNGATEQRILAVHQGNEVLPLQLDNIADPVERLFLPQMQNQAGRFNLQELLNGVRLWRDFTGRDDVTSGPEGWAAAVEYLIALWDYHQAEITDELTTRYSTTAETVQDNARAIAQAVNATQFDDRYSIHPDPIAHYKAVFDELGVDFQREQIRESLLNNKIFDTIEPVPLDDQDFYGPG